MRVRVRSDKLQLAVRWHKSHTEMKDRCFASNMIWEGRTILLSLEEGNQVCTFVSPSQQRLPNFQEFPYELKCKHGGLLPCWGDVECEAKFSDDYMEIEMPPLYERPWPLFKEDGMLEEHAFNCAVARARSLWRSGCSVKNARAGLRLTTNAFNAIPYEAWKEVQSIFNQPRNLS